MFLFYKKEILLLFVQLSQSPGKSWKSPGKVLEKVEKSPGKSWNLNYFFWWEPWSSKRMSEPYQFFCCHYQVINKMFFFFFLSFFPNLLCSFYLNLILFCLYFLLEIKNIIKNKLARSYVRQYSFIKNITLISFELIALQVVGNSHQCLY